MKFTSLILSAACMLGAVAGHASDPDYNTRLFLSLHNTIACLKIDNEVNRIDHAVASGKLTLVQANGSTNYYQRLQESLTRRNCAADDLDAKHLKFEELSEKLLSEHFQTHPEIMMDYIKIESPISVRRRLLMNEELLKRRFQDNNKP